MTSISDQPQVDDGEDEDPDRVDEVPVDEHAFDAARALLADEARPREAPDGRQRDDAHDDVQAVDAREGEERRAEHAGRGEEAFAHEIAVLDGLARDERDAQEDGGAQPDAERPHLVLLQGELRHVDRAARAEEDHRVGDDGRQRRAVGEELGVELRGVRAAPEEEREEAAEEDDFGEDEHDGAHEVVRDALLVGLVGKLVHVLADPARHRGHHDEEAREHGEGAVVVGRSVGAHSVGREDRHEEKRRAEGQPQGHEAAVVRVVVAGVLRGVRMIGCGRCWVRQGPPPSRGVLRAATGRLLLNPMSFRRAPPRGTKQAQRRWSEGDTPVPLIIRRTQGRPIRMEHMTKLEPPTLGGARRYPAFINGKWVPSSDNKWIDVTNPADGSVVGHVPALARKDVEAAIDAAHAARRKIRDVPAIARIELLERAAHLLEADRSLLVDVVVAESGKPVAVAKGEVKSTLERLRLTAQEARSMHGEYIPGDWVEDTKNKMAVVRRVPRGVVAAITPFNYPLFIAAAKVAPALVAGNTVVVKPSTETPLSMLFFAKAMEEAGLPAGALN